MANYLGSARVTNGGDYSPPAGTDRCTIQLSYGYRDGVAVSTGHTHNGSAITKEQEANINIAGLGDPTVAAALSISPASSGALATTWDRAMTAESSFALTIDNVNQTTPVFDKNTASYTTDANPTFTVPTIPAHSTVIYYKFHAASAAATFTAPVGFDSRENNGLLTSPAYRGFVCYTRDFLTEQTNFVLGADSNDSPTGGVHGYIVLQTESAPTDVTIGDVDGDNIVERSQTGVVLSGTNLEATAGDLIMAPTDNINDASAITITTTNWTDTAITFDMPTAINMLYGEKFFFVRTDSLAENAIGKSVTLIAPAANNYITIKEQAEMGVLKDVTGLELDADQIEWQVLSNEGGTVYIDVSGTVWIEYPAAAPTSDEIYIRLGDNSDQTWSSASLETISIGSTTAVIAANDSDHLLTSDNVTLSARTPISADDSFHSVLSDNLTLTANTPIAIDSSTHETQSDNVTLTAHSSININDSAHALSSDQVTLTADNPSFSISINDSVHSQTVDSLALTAHTPIGIDDSSHGLTSDNLTLAAHTNLTIDDSSHDVSSDNVVIGAGSVLSIDDSSHGLTSDEPALVAHSPIVINDSDHAVSSDNVVLIPDNPAVTLTIDDGVHSVLSDTVAATAETPISINDSTHGHTADVVQLFGHTPLAIDDSAHSLTSDEVSLSGGVAVAVDDSQHSLSSTVVQLTARTPLSIDDGFHAVSSDNPVLSRILTIDSSRHAVSSDVVRFFSPSEARTLTVASQDRTIFVLNNDRQMMA